MTAYKILKHMLNLCTMWNNATPTEKPYIAWRIRGAASMADTCGYTVEIWTELPVPETLCYVRIGNKETGEILGQSPNNTMWYNCYKFEKILEYGTEHIKY